MGLEETVNVTIREATRDDAELLRSIEARDGFPYPYKKTAQDYLKYMDEGTVFWIAEVNGEPAGYISSVNCDYLGSVNRLHFLAVVKEWQGKGMAWEGGGVGTRLVKHFEGHAKNNKKDCAIINVYDNNQRAVNFYSRLGYRIWFTIPHRYEDGISAVVMRKDFTQKYPEREAAHSKRLREQGQQPQA